MISQVALYLALGVAAACSFRSPVVGLGAYYVLALARPQDVYWWWGETHLSFAIGGVVCALWLLGWLQRSHDGPGRSPIAILLLILFFLQTISASLAGDQGATWDHIDRVGKMTLFFYITVSLVNSRARFRLMVLLAAASLAYLGWWGNWEWYVGGVRGGTNGELAGPGWQVRATLTDRNLFAYMLAAGVPLCFFVFFIETASRLRWLALASLPLLANAIMLTFSRAAFLGLVSSSVWCALRLKRPAAMLGFGLVGALTIFMLAGPEVIARIATIADYEQDSSAMSRLESWKAGIRMIADNPLFGVGAGHYGQYSSIYNPKAKTGILAHNTFIEITAETGLLAGFLFVSIILLPCIDLHRLQTITWPIREMRWAYYSAAMLQAALLSYAIGAMFVSLPYFELFYLLLGLTVSLERIVRRTIAPLPLPSRSMIPSAA